MVSTLLATTSTITNWLTGLAQEFEFQCASQSIPFAHDEDSFSKNLTDTKVSKELGIGLNNLLEKYDADFTGPLLELGCGSGFLSQGIIAAPTFPLIIFSDTSTRFLQLTAKNLSQIDSNFRDYSRLIVLDGDELYKLPPKSISVIVMRSTLHHLKDIPGFFAAANCVLSDSGLLVLEEPLLDGHVLMAGLAQFIPVIAERAGVILTEHQLAQVKLFIDTIKYYASKTADKSVDGDRHLFRVDELLIQARNAGLELYSYPNVTLQEFSNTDARPLNPSAARNQSWLFSNTMLDHFRLYMGFDADLVETIEQTFRPYLAFGDDLFAAENGPHTWGVFVAKKRYSLLG